jgi:hypothetical protein
MKGHHISSPLRKRLWKGVSETVDYEDVNTLGVGLPA